MSGHTPGPWRWEFNAQHKTVEICGGRPEFDKTVMGFGRWGMSGAAPMFMGADDGFLILHRLQDRKDWIKHFAGREHHADWCAGIDHPDARLIAAAPELLEALVAVLDYCVDDEGQPTIATARAAIDKATGGDA